MLHSLESLRAEVCYRQRDLVADAAQERLGRQAARTRLFRWLTSRDADRLRSDVAELIVGAGTPESPLWSPESTPPHGAEVR